MHYDRTDCRLCGGKVRPVLDLGLIPLANLFPAEPDAGERYPLGLKQCETCGHVQVGHVIADSMIYGKDYKYSTQSAQKPALEAQAKALRARYPAARVALEIGANNGLNMHALCDAGFRSVIGVDPSGTDPHIWKKPFNAENTKWVVPRVGHVGLIVANNVFAHIDDLDEVFEAINLLLEDDGALVFEVQYLPAMMASGSFDMIYHEHRDYHTLGPIALFLDKHGLLMTDYEFLPQHGGSIRVHAARHGTPKPAPAEVLDWDAFRIAIMEAKAHVVSELDKRDKVVAFGATGKACTLINYFGIADRISHCVDSTPAKQGRYIAGTSIRILPESQLGDWDIFLTAWNYADLIRAKFPGRELILPFEPAHA